MEAAEPAAVSTDTPTPGLPARMGGEFVCDGQKMTLTLTEDSLTWAPTDCQQSVSVKWLDVITCHRGRVSPKCPTQKLNTDDKEVCITVHYVSQQADHIWKHCHKTFERGGGNPEGILFRIVEKCRPGRPQRLLVIINPVGGRKKGEAQYANTVAPLLQLAQVETDVIVSKFAGHVEEIGKTYDFSKTDGIMILGGDGTYQELLHTLLPRIQREAGVDLDDPEAEIVSLPYPIGMMPTGSANGLCRAAYGCFDVLTAALHIITGRTHTTALTKVQVGGKHAYFAGVVVAAGSFADVIVPDASSRWLGALRYPVGILTFLMSKRREFNVKLDYLPLNTDLPEGESQVDAPKTENGWKSVEGSFTGVCCLPCNLDKDPETGAMIFSNLKDGMTLFLESQCGIFKYLSFVYKMIKLRGDVFDMEFISKMEIKRYKYRIFHNDDEVVSPRNLELEQMVNIDGEVRRLESPDVDVRHHPRIMTMFGAGVNYASPPTED